MAKHVQSVLLYDPHTSIGLKLGDPYNETFHLTLNIRPGHDPRKRPHTEWLNMGYWKDTNIFPDACEALAMKLIAAGHCIPGGHVLDVGHACGDSLLLHLSHDPSVPRPSTLTGITSLKGQHQRARTRLGSMQASIEHPPKVSLYHGDAICRDIRSDKHPLSPTAASQPFTTILALDCAYHFRTREVFLCQSFSRLRPGGYIALADLAVVQVSRPFRWFTQILALPFPAANLITLKEYENQLLQIGFVDVQIEDITPDVFPGFRTFLRSKGGQWWIFEKVLGLWKGGRFVIASGRKP